MSVPRRVNDGNFDIAHQIGSDEWTTPFSDKGDDISFEVRRRYRVDQSKYVRIPKMTKIKTSKGSAYLVLEGEARDVTGGLLEFTRTYASIPQPRIEGSSIVYNMQFVQDGQLIEFPIPMNANVRYEYSLVKFGQQRAPKAIPFGQNFIAVGGWGNFIAGQEYLAEDANVDIYKSGIFVRRGIYITWPSFTNGLLV